MDEKNYRYRDIIPEERKKVTKEWKVKGERRISNPEISAEEEIKTGEDKRETAKESEKYNKKESAEETDNSDSRSTDKNPDEEEKTGESGKNDMDMTIEGARDSVKKAIEDVVDLGNTLLGTQKGREHIEKKAKKAGKKLTKTLEYIIEDAGKKLKK